MSTEDAVKNYLDAKIKHWTKELRERRARLDEIISSGERVDEIQGGVTAIEKAVSYIDAYQTMRHDLFPGG
jgi:hypothetical protein